MDYVTSHPRIESVRDDDEIGVVVLARDPVRSDVLGPIGRHRAVKSSAQLTRESASPTGRTVGGDQDPDSDFGVPNRARP